MPPADPFVDRVMGGVRRRERRLPLVIAALALSALILAVPALAALRAHPALQALTGFSRSGFGEAFKAVADNPAFWAVLVVAAGWLVWLAGRALGARR